MFGCGGGSGVGIVLLRKVDLVGGGALVVLVVMRLVMLLLGLSAGVLRLVVMGVELDLLIVHFKVTLRCHSRLLCFPFLFHILRILAPFSLSLTSFRLGFGFLLLFFFFRPRLFSSSGSPSVLCKRCSRGGSNRGSSSSGWFGIGCCVGLSRGDN